MCAHKKLFQKMEEDFICERCGFVNIGDGYTNHCRQCLWSKHVDINPGDREEECRGMMEPVQLENNGDVFYILHKCVVCGKEKRNKARVGDNFDELIKISQKGK